MIEFFIGLGVIAAVCAAGLSWLAFWFCVSYLLQKCKVNMDYADSIAFAGLSSPIWGSAVWLVGKIYLEVFFS